MWYPVKIKIKNLLSHSDTEFTYQKSLNLINGINLDESIGVTRQDLEEKSENELPSDLESNGSGKSVLIEAEYFAITGESLRGIVTNELIMNNESETEVEWELQNDFLNMNILINRKIFMKQPSILTLIYNKTETKIFGSGNLGVLEGNKEILNLLGIKKEDLTNYYIISKEKYNSFYYSNDESKKGLITRFSGSYLMDGISDDIQLDINPFIIKQQQIERDILSEETKIELINDEIQEIPNKLEFEKNKRERIIEIEDKIKETKELIIKNQTIKLTQQIQLKKYQDHLNIWNKRQDKLQKQYPDNSKEILKLNTKIIEIEGKIEEQNKKIKGFESELREIKEFQQDLELLIKGEVQCPDCNKKFVLNNDLGFTLEEAKEKLKESKNLQFEISEEIVLEKGGKEYNLRVIDKTKQEIRTTNRRNDKFDNLFIKLKLLIKHNNFLISPIEEKLMIAEKTYKLFQQNLINWKQDIENIENEQLPQQKQLEEKLEKVNKNIEELNKKLIPIKNEISQKKEWIDLMFLFRNYLTNKALKNIEGQTNLYLQQIGSSLQIELSCFTLLADGKTVREKISVEVLKNGMSSGNFKKHSFGEKAKIEIATILALQKLLNTSNASGGLNLLSVDEILESVSKKGMTNLIDSLLSLQETNFTKIITHINLDKSYPHITRKFVKENDITYLMN